MKGRMRLDINHLPNRVVSALIVLASVAAAAFLLLMSDGGAYQQQIQAFQRQIASAVAERDALNAQPLLRKVELSWSRLKEIATNYDVQMIPLEKSMTTPYAGATGAWHWVLKGELKDIALVLAEAQSDIPIVLGEMSYQAGRATVSISVLGAM